MRPHAPQFATVSTRVHVPLQHICPEGQLPPQGRVLTQRPAVQRSSVPHGRSQPPQCIAFVCVSTQPAPQQVLAPVHAGAAPQRGVITLAEVTITGRIQKPIAAVDVNRIQPKLTLAELRQPFIDRIEQAIYKDPF